MATFGNGNTRWKTLTPRFHNSTETSVWPQEEISWGHTLVWTFIWPGGCTPVAPRNAPGTPSTLFAQSGPLGLWWQSSSLNNRGSPLVAEAASKAGRAWPTFATTV